MHKGHLPGRNLHSYYRKSYDNSQWSQEWEAKDCRSQGGPSGKSETSLWPFFSFPKGPPFLITPRAEAGAVSQAMMREKEKEIPSSL